MLVSLYFQCSLIYWSSFVNVYCSYECKLCLTLHNNEGNYLAHTQGKRHQTNLAKRAAREAKDAPAQPQPNKRKVNPRKTGKLEILHSIRYIFTWPASGGLWSNAHVLLYLLRELSTITWVCLHAWSKIVAAVWNGGILLAESDLTLVICFVSENWETWISSDKAVWIRSSSTFLALPGMFSIQYIYCNPSKGIHKLARRGKSVLQIFM